NPGRAVPNFTEESLPSSSTFDAQAVGDQEMVDVTPQGTPGTFLWHDPQGGNFSGTLSAQSLSHDGRYTAFISSQTDLVPGDTNDIPDVFVRDRATNTTERVSLREDGAQIQLADFGPYIGPIYTDISISADGRYVAYATFAALDPAARPIPDGSS